jgi:hypothetical protein
MNVGKRGKPELKFPHYDTKKAIWKENTCTRRGTTTEHATTAKAQPHFRKAKDSAGTS